MAVKRLLFSSLDRAQPKTTRVKKDLVKLSSEDGCAMFKLNATELNKLYKGGKKLQVVAVITEAGTGSEEGVEASLNFEASPFKISHEGSPDEHTVLANGGFPYVGEIQGRTFAYTYTTEVQGFYGNVIHSSKVMPDFTVCTLGLPRIFGFSF